MYKRPAGRRRERESISPEITHYATTLFSHIRFPLSLWPLTASIDFGFLHLKQKTTPSFEEANKFKMFFCSPISRALFLLAATTAFGTPIISLQSRQTFPSLGSSTSNELQSGNCREVIFIFARGSTETGNMVCQ